MSAKWQRFTHDPEDTNAAERCAFPSHGHGSHRGHPGCQTCAESMGVCLRRKGHPSDWHEGRSRSGNLVSWPADDRPDYQSAALGDKP